MARKPPAIEGGELEASNVSRGSARQMRAHAEVATSKIGIGYSTSKSAES